MTIFEKVSDWLESAGLTDGYKVQLAYWEEQKTDTGAMKYIVVQPDGGTARYQDLGADDYVLVNIISAENDASPAIATAQSILDYAESNPEDSCLNFIANVNGFTTPIPTEEGRIIIRLRFRTTA